MNTDYIKDFYCYAIRPQIIKRSLIVAVIVGTVLNMINQGDAITGSSSFNLLKCMLTYVVPYCVATYGSVSALMAMRDKPESLGSCAVPGNSSSETSAANVPSANTPSNTAGNSAGNSAGNLSGAAVSSPENQ